VFEHCRHRWGLGADQLRAELRGESVRVVLLLCADTSTPADDRIALTLETLGPQAPPEEGVLP
jgi:hypothetical protein